MPPNLNSVATLPCEMLMSENYWYSETGAAFNSKYQDKM